MNRRLIAIAQTAALVGALAAGHASAQRGFRGGQQQAPVVHNAPYDGRFRFARIKYETAPGGFYYMGLPAWAHGYPKAENNLGRILKALSTMRVNVDAANVVALDDPELMTYPVVFMTEAGFWTMTDKEVAGFRAYLRKGGFVIFDDFRDDFRNSTGWANFVSLMSRVQPDARFLDLDPSYPIFHSFYQIDSFSIIPQMYDRGRPILRGLFEDNDPKKRMLAMINFDTDVSDFWEFSGQGFRPIAEDNEAYKLGVNYMVYAFTH
jgi:hypothetical protein